MAADPRFAGARPDDVRVGRRNRERANRGDRLIVEDGLPMRASVSGLEDPARSGAGVIGVRLTGHAADCADSVANRTDVTLSKRSQRLTADLLDISERELTSPQPKDHL